MSTEALLQERKSTHGEYKEHARCTQAIMRAVMTERNWEKLSDIQRESLHMFAHKMGRIAVGNPDEPDHWKDIAGYAVLVEQRLAQPVTTTDGHAEWTKSKATLKREAEFELRPLGPVPGDEVPELHGPALDAFNAAIARHPAAPRPASFDIGGGRFEVGETCHYRAGSGGGLMLCQITSILQDGEADIDLGALGHKTVKWGALNKLPLFDVKQQRAAKDWQQDAAESSLIRRTGQRTPEDGAQHASVVPWVVGAEFFTNSGISDEHVRAFWFARNMTLFVLEPYVTSGTIPRVLRTCYNLRGDGNWTLRIGDCPPDVREFFPNLPREQNMKEWEERPEWQRVLYTWDANGNKYALTDLTRAWHVEEE